MALPPCDNGCGNEAAAARNEFRDTTITYLCPPCELDYWALTVDTCRREGILSLPDPPYPTAEPAEEAVPAEKPARRPRIVKEPEPETPGPAGAETAGETPPDAGDRRGDDRLEAGGGDGGEPGPAAPGA